MIFRKEHGLANVATLVERTSRYVVLFRNNDRQSKPIVDRLIDELAPLPAEARRSITFDRGSEFAARAARSSPASVPGLGSAIPTPLGRRARSRTPTAGRGAGYPGTPTC